MKRFLHHPKVIEHARPLKPLYNRLFKRQAPEIPALDRSGILKSMNGRGVFLFSFGRSGTTVFRDFISSHPNVVSLGEVLNQDAFHSFFHYYNKRFRRTGYFPSLFESSFYEFMQEQVDSRAPARCIFDLKFETLHLVEGNFRLPDGKFKLFDHLKDSGNPVILLERRDAVARFLSVAVAVQRNRFHSFQTQSGGKLEPFEVDMKAMQRSVNAVRTQLETFRRHFAGYDRFIDITYEDMFVAAGPEEEKQFSPELTEKLAALLQVDARFDTSPKLEKVSNLPLESYVLNHEDVTRYRASVLAA